VGRAACCRAHAEWSASKKQGASMLRGFEARGQSVAEFGRWTVVFFFKKKTEPY
jgi:hypothetical protein